MICVGAAVCPVAKPCKPRSGSWEVGGGWKQGQVAFGRCAHTHPECPGLGTCLSPPHPLSPRRGPGPAKLRPQPSPTRSLVLHPLALPLDQSSQTLIPETCQLRIHTCHPLGLLSVCPLLHPSHMWSRSGAWRGSAASRLASAAGFLDDSPGLCDTLHLAPRPIRHHLRGCTLKCAG